MFLIRLVKVILSPAKDFPGPTELFRCRISFEVYEVARQTLDSPTYLGILISQERLEAPSACISSPEVTRSGNALNSIGLPVTSNYNPSRLTDNCIFMTLASLLGSTVDHLSREINIEMPANGSGGFPILGLRPVLKFIACFLIH